MLHAERLSGRDKQMHAMKLNYLPDGAFISLDGAPLAVRGDRLLRWSEGGYVEKIARGRGTANVLTPPSIVVVLSAGYRPQWHPSANALFGLWWADPVAALVIASSAGLPARQ